MSEPNEAIEVTAVSVDEAIKLALDKLRASEDDVIIQVLSTPRAGVLGLGVRQARVRVERRTPEGARSGVMSPPPAPPLRPRPPTQPTAARPERPSPGRHQQPAMPRSSSAAPPPRQRPQQRDQEREQPPPPRVSDGHAQRRAENSTRREESGADEGDAGRKTAGLNDQVREATTILSQILK
ncbi:MAG: Jag N-terminal domain-containing protein, partial [Candidatus Binataceae bacterium]